MINTSCGKCIFSVVCFGFFIPVFQVMTKEYHGFLEKSVTYDTKNTLTEFFFECNMKTVFKFRLIVSE